MADKILRMENGEIKLVDDLLELMPEIDALRALKYNKQPGDLDGRKRTRYKQECTYVWFMYNKMSPYREYDEKDRKAESLLTAGLDPNYEFSPELILFIKKYEKCNTSRISKLIKGAEIGIDRLTEYFNTIDFTKETDTGAQKNKPIDFINTIAKLGVVADGLKALELRQKSDDNTFITTRGDHEPGWIMERDTNIYDGDTSTEDS